MVKTIVFCTILGFVTLLGGILNLEDNYLSWGWSIGLIIIGLILFGIGAYLSDHEMQESLKDSAPKKDAP